MQELEKALVNEELLNNANGPDVIAAGDGLTLSEAFINKHSNKDDSILRVKNRLIVMADRRDILIQNMDSISYLLSI
jgi:hypothetical protein